MQTNQIYLILMISFPLITALLNAFILKKCSIRIICTVSTLGVFAAFLCALNLYLFGTANNTLPIAINLFSWISLSDPQYTLNIPFAFVVDKLSILFLLVTTGIGFLIHMYSGQYMSSEKKPYRFFVYMNLFIVSMVILLLGSNMLVTFLGWEGVGVCSYLLIGYWFEDKNNALAAIKAFVMNRIGDVGFLLAMFLCLKFFGTLDYSILQQNAINTNVSNLVITFIGFGILLAVAGKSAQIPLYTWLPDAMAGPTPVSALIHAATMVTAGIYLLNRVSYLLVLSPVVMHTIAIIGAATAFFAATIALAQNDIKKILAYSTCSQLGYMVLACGVGAFDYGVAHVITHAFFKACLFLGAGSVIYALHHEQDIRHMGGIFKKMPITSITFLISVFAIIGLPPFSGFFTKDAILASAWAGQYGHPILWGIGALTAGLTAFYMLRLTVLVFFGRCRAHDSKHISENNLVMTIPLMVLAFLSAFGGVVLKLFATIHLSHSVERNLMIGSLIFVVLGVLVAIFIYRKGIHGADKVTKSFGSLYRLIAHKWKIDELYQAVVVVPLACFGRVFYEIIDRRIVENIVNGVPKTFYFGTSVISDIQSGNVRSYLKLMFLGVLILFLILTFY